MEKVIFFNLCLLLEQKSREKFQQIVLKIHFFFIFLLEKKNICPLRGTGWADIFFLLASLLRESIQQDYTWSSCLIELVY